MVRYWIIATLLTSVYTAVANYEFDAVEQDRLIKQENIPERYTPEFSTAGFFQTDPTVRKAANFNIGWRFFKGDAHGAKAVQFDDSQWELVNVPHGLEPLPLSASGGVNYQGPTWYRKHFKIKPSTQGRKVFIHFEAIMGKSKIWVNGKLVKERFGGFHPIHIDVTDALNYGASNVIAVRTDNSDDPIFPPGKPQDVLDFCYFGGIYRDVHLITTDPVYVSNPNAVDRVAGGGLFISYDNLAGDSIDVVTALDIVNEDSITHTLQVELQIKDHDGKVVGQSTETIAAGTGTNVVSTQVLKVASPHLWHVDDPYLHNLFVIVKDELGTVRDTFRRRIGLRTIEFKGRDGFYLNGKPFEDALIGANRHQDYGYLGNALPNTTHWRDAQKLRQANMRVIRNAHYPQDPAFMDACDELGLFVIVNIPGWQFWNKDPVFAKQIMSDIRNMVRRDRNHPCVIMWEPSLNESWYPAEFDLLWHNATHEEYPYPGCYTACDNRTKGQEYYDILYLHYGELKQYPEEMRTTFTREWSDCPDNWKAQNSPSRMSKAWGEQAMLVQAQHFYRPAFPHSCLQEFYTAPRQHLGGSLWHSFDHQRGYHPDPFWGGIMDAVRQPKTSYYLFRSQLPIKAAVPHIQTGPFIRIAHEMSPASGDDITVFSNCDEIRLTVLEKEIGTRLTLAEKGHHAPVIFEDAFCFNDVRNAEMARVKKKELPPPSILAEGLVDGKVVARCVKIPTGRRTHIILRADLCGATVTANGSDIVPVVAYLTDTDGRVKRLTDEYVHFSVEGAGELVNDAVMQANPVKTIWGEAVALIRTGTEPGIIRIKAEALLPGSHSSHSAVLELETVAPNRSFVHSENPELGSVHQTSAETAEVNMLAMKLQQVEQELNELKLKEVERQQAEFGE